MLVKLKIVSRGHEFVIRWNPSFFSAISFRISYLLTLFFVAHFSSLALVTNFKAAPVRDFFNQFPPPPLLPWNNLYFIYILFWSIDFFSIFFYLLFLTFPVCLFVCQCPGIQQTQCIRCLSRYGMFLCLIVSFSMFNSSWYWLNNEEPKWPMEGLANLFWIISDLSTQ